MLGALFAVMTLASGTFADDARVPRRMVAQRCSGENRSPALQWNGEPPGTKSFALVIHDPDAPHPGGFYHWIVTDIPTSVHHLDEATSRFTGYVGPCPPPGRIHHYRVTIYALDVAHLGVVPGDPGGTQRAIAHDALASATIVGLYSMPQ